MMKRNVKKTTPEQFNLLKAEMAIHPAAARGYGVGANRIVVDAEWKDIVEKLNEIGPPHRTMTEWKKVWSDVRLRMRKRFCEELLNDGQKIRVMKKPKKEKVKVESEEDQLLDALNSSTSIYVSENQYVDPEQCITPNIHEEDEESHHEEYYDNNPLHEEELNNTNHNDNKHYNSNFRSSHDPTQSHLNDDKPGFMEQTMYTLQNQMEHQNKLMEHLTKISSNMAALMERHVAALERKNNLKERQLRSSEYHNIFVRRQEARRKLRTNSLCLNLNKS